MKPVIYILGLGPGGAEELTQDQADLLRRLGKMYLRTMDMLDTRWLTEWGITLHSFDALYEREKTYEGVYLELVKALIQVAKEEGEVVYGIPGHPRVAERSVSLLEELGEKEGIEIKILGGRSFFDDLFHSLRFDPVEGFLLLDAYTLTRERLNSRMHTVILQLADAMTASDVKLTLMERYPDDYEVTLASRLGSDREKKLILPLYRLDQERDWEWDNYTLLYLPPLGEEEWYMNQFETVRQIVATLRSPGGCPWDREQTHRSLRPYLIEEAYEVIEAIDTEDLDALQEELGDLLLQILLHSRIAEEEGFFHVEDVIKGLSEKLIRRHPHVFGEKKAKNVNEAWANWKEMKEEEKKAKGEGGKEVSILDEVKVGLPPLIAAVKLQKRASKAGFDWEKEEDVARKVEEEWREFQEALSVEEKEEELGDLLFAIVNLARFERLDPEKALSNANRKFRRRFRYIEERLRERGIPLNEATLEEMDKLWQEEKIHPASSEKKQE
ncbi:nucleoside triphosphate pyrophosphohydrolase [Thermicanus aegyptius]|uniref:nucleoside triphosphate pyrophosphohydrolase n=1 Tax=Thermicanus aegyptius TaxID=94009 RepID=UPI000587C9DC|nr:nucleoside triphosphate pyrophosphohydrolase [Thermicanus aegyptius]